MDAQNSKCKLSDMVCFICTRNYFYVPSMQIEGAWNEHGKGPSTWDHFCHNHPGKILNSCFSFVYVSCICTNNKIDAPFQYYQHDAILYVYEYTEMIAGWSNGDVAVNSYHLYEVSTKMPLTSYIPKCGAPPATRSNAVQLIIAKIQDTVHYRISLLCRVPQTLGKALNTLGKCFAECSTRHTAHGDCLLGKGVFAECFSSSTWQTLCRVSRRPSAKKKVDGTEG